MWGVGGVLGRGLGRGVGSAMRVRGDRRAKLKKVRSKAESKANWRWPRRAESIRNGVVENENHKRTTFGEGA